MPASLEIQLQNQTSSSEVYAYITGLALQKNNARVLLKADGQDLYYPEEPRKILSPLTEDCAIPLGPPGNTVTVKIPQMAGGRIWFSREGKLTFLLNPPGPALVEPSVLNPSDPNRNVDFSFAEFTLNNDQLFANISYVDFVPRLPIALTLQDGNGVQHVSGMPSDGLEKVCEGLRAQKERDGKPWNKLIVSNKGRPLRALSPMHGNAVRANFSGYFEPLVEEAWKKYHCNSNCQMKINTQAAHGVLPGAIAESDELDVGGEKFKKPTTADILGCNSGPFTTGPSPKRNAIIPRLAAAFARAAVLDAEHHPSDPSTFYKRDPANHYARIVHEVNLDGKGYAFAYDDVQPDGGADQSGKVNAGSPSLFIVSVGGENAYAGDRLP
ncbi:hypothetical protein MCOR07_004866 [Pyricularia oryzae]|uniref:GH64 domain-containing protein n=1 Tax=Pyricularia grisea TaxID=148305 RepID=A0ABQ8NGL4_PYRGI|nr:hypothetical protein MCOR01_003550 [Pyricularia oryzae]KAI6296768.1 hypothetical protein MCOR33_006712 [Pyricularia grisea]KAI6322923.1 hypothetical protein MCOR30_007442 [Pyricularia oryzae]KAI6417139.1 hypothetical protein MCOR20_000594 [Pyricularia oryzae]KAI6621478.1 hypothetical protein MCOR07_004866 [Pyricularia oryzae]